MKTTFLFLFNLILVGIAQGQLERTIHQTFAVGESNSISFDLVSDTTLIVPWAGNTLMTETKIELYYASPSILKHFIEQEKRYVIDMDTLGGSIKLYSSQKERKPIRTHNGECPEIVQIKVFVPDNFAQSNQTTLVKIQ